MNNYAVVIDNTTILCDTKERAIRIVWEKVAEGVARIWEREGNHWVRKVNGVSIEKTDCLV